MLHKQTSPAGLIDCLHHRVSHARAVTEKNARRYEIKVLIARLKCFKVCFKLCCRLCVLISPSIFADLVDSRYGAVHNVYENQNNVHGDQTIQNIYNTARDDAGEPRDHSSHRAAPC